LRSPCQNTGLRGHLIDGERRLAIALAAYPEPTALRAWALIEFARSVEDLELERRLAEEAIAIFERVGDVRGLARARYALANALTTARRWAEARELMEESVRAFERLGDSFHKVAARRGLAWMYEELGDTARYRELTEQNLAEARALGIRRIEARSLGALGMLALSEGRIADARGMLAESYRIDDALGNLVFISIDLARFAAVSAAEGRVEDAAVLLARSMALREEIGWTPESWAVEEYEQTLAVVTEKLRAAVFADAWKRGSVLGVDEAMALALAADAEPLALDDAEGAHRGAPRTGEPTE